MGTQYNFVCKTCKENFDIDKIHNAKFLIPKLAEKHKGHEYGIYSEHQEECCECFEYRETKYKEIEIWRNGKLIDEYSYNRFDKELTESEMNQFYNNYNAEKLI